MEKLSVFLVPLNILFLFLLSPCNPSVMCFVENITNHVCPHKDIRSLPTQWFSPWLMAKAVFLEQIWCRWTVCLSVSVCVGLVLSWLQHCYSQALELSHVGAAMCYVPFHVALWAPWWNDHFNTVKTVVWSSFLHYWTLYWCVFRLWICNHANACQDGDLSALGDDLCGSLRGINYVGIFKVINLPLICSLSVTYRK